MTAIKGAHHHSTSPWRRHSTAPRQSSRCAALALLATGLLVVTGCPPPPAGPFAPQPLRSTGEIVAAIEHNAAKFDRPLYCPALTVTARYVDENKKQHAYNLEGTLAFRRPRDLQMDLRPGLGEQVMQIGSNNEDYWIWIEPEVKSMRWGHYRHVGKPCAEKISIRPDQLVASLALSGLPGPDEGLIGPLRKFGKKFDILYYGRRTTEGGWRLDREYHIDRNPPHQARLVLFFDEFGRLSMSAFLDRYAEAWKAGPQVPRDVSIIWHQDEGKFTMNMDILRGVEKLTPRAFVRPTPGAGLPDGLRVIQVDADCDFLAPPANAPAGE